MPLIVAGDFNAAPNAPEIIKGMREYLQVCSDEATYPSDHPTMKMDYIFCKPAEYWKQIDAATPVVFLSDHLPVIGEVKLH